MDKFNTLKKIIKSYGIKEREHLYILEIKNTNFILDIKTNTIKVSDYITNETHFYIKNDYIIEVFEKLINSEGSIYNNFLCEMIEVFKIIISYIEEYREV